MPLIVRLFWGFADSRDLEAIERFPIGDSFRAWAIDSMAGRRLVRNFDIGLYVQLRKLILSLRFFHAKSIA